jgi:hypothetical protein
VVTAPGRAACRACSFWRQAPAQAFLARHNSLRGARLGELVHPPDYPAFVAETADGQLAGMLTYVLAKDRQQCEILTLHADEQWRPDRRRPVDRAGWRSARSRPPGPLGLRIHRKRQPPSGQSGHLKRDA